MVGTCKKIITVTCDQNYSPYSHVFVNSLNEHNNNIDVVVRAVNCRDDTIRSIEGLGSNVTVINDTTKLSTKRDIMSHGQELAYDGLFDSMSKNKTSIRSPRMLCSESMVYSSNIKFMTIKDLLFGNNDSVVIYMDIDSIIRGDISLLFNKTLEGDIAMFKDVPYTEQHPGSTRLKGNEVLYHGGLICVNRNETTLKLMSDWCEVVSQNMFNWDIDEELFYTAHNNDDVNIICVDKTYKDEDLSHDSLIWSGAGQTKFTHDLYIAECKKYDERFK